MLCPEYESLEENVQRAFRSEEEGANEATRHATALAINLESRHIQQCRVCQAEGRTREIRTSVSAMMGTV